MSSVRRRGFAHERDLARKLWNMGFAVMRAPASGSKAKRTRYPDLVAIMKGTVLAFEVKTTRNPSTIYIKREQVEKLLEFTRRAGGYPFIAVKIIGTGNWRFIPIKELEETSSGNYKITREKLGKGLSIRDLLVIACDHRRIDEYF